MKSDDKKKGDCFFKPLKSKIKSIKNQWFFILLTFILDNSDFFSTKFISFFHF
jgi:hypothetical protein